MELFGDIWTFSYFSYISYITYFFYFSYISTFPTLLAWSAQWISKSQRYKITPLIQTSPPPSGPPIGPPSIQSSGLAGWGPGYSPRIINTILEVNSLAKIFDSINIRKVNQSCTLKKKLCPPPIWGGVMGLGSPIIGPPIIHFIGALESVEIPGI